MGRDTRTKRYAEQIGSGYVTPVESPTVDNFASLTSTGDIQDSGYDHTSFVKVTDDKSLQGDSTTNRVLRQIELTIEDGTNANTLKCTVTSLWNGDAIGVTDNVAKGATTGSFTLNAGGTLLTIEAAGLSGNVVMAQGTLGGDASGTANPTLECKDTGNDIILEINSSNTAQDLTAMVDVADPIIIQILYLTDA